MNTYPSNVEAIAVKQAPEQKLLVGDEVYKQLEDEDFLHAWDILLDACPWATVFQGKEFITAWYKANREKVTPVLVLSYNGEELIGLLALAKNKNRRFFGAGIHDAEYQAWLAHPNHGDEFVPKALRELEKRFQHFELELRFLPPNTPLQWTATDQKWKYRCLLRPRTRPVMQVDAAHIAKELRKKNRKEKVNRLKRMGTLSFERITDRDTFSHTFDVIADQFRFRQAARYNSTLFKSDPNKKRFFLDLFDHNLLHVTVLKLANEIIAANVGIAGKNWVHLKGMNTWSPFYAKYSPGIIHFLLLGQQLSQEGYTVFDLTPGDDPYKDVLATGQDEVHELWVYSNRKAYLKNLFRKDLYFKLLKRFGMTPLAFEVELQKQYQSIKADLQSLKQQGVSAAWRNFIKHKGSIATPILYEIDFAGLTGTSENYCIKKNSLNDLLGYEPGAGKIKSEFLTEAMKKYEAGEHSYTLTEAGQLMACVWLKKADKETRLPSGAMLLHACYCHPKYENQLLCLLKAVALRIKKEGIAEKLYYSDSEDFSSAMKEIGTVLSQSTTGKG